MQLHARLAPPVIPSGARMALEGHEAPARDPEVWGVATAKSVGKRDRTARGAATLAGTGREAAQPSWS